MPRHQEAKKDVISCEKLRKGANIHWPVDLRIGKPVRKDIIKWIHSLMKRTRGTETSKYPEEEKETSIPRVAASEKGTAQVQTKKRT